MNAITINSRPSNTGSIIADFTRAVEAEQSKAKIGQFYKCGKAFFRFYSAGKYRFGLDIFLPTGKAHFKQSRIQPNGKRREMGICEICENEPDFPTNEEAREILETAGIDAEEAGRRALQLICEKTGHKWKLSWPLDPCEYTCERCGQMMQN